MTTQNSESETAPAVGKHDEVRLDHDFLDEGLHFGLRDRHAAAEASALVREQAERLGTRQHGLTRELRVGLEQIDEAGVGVRRVRRPRRCTSWTSGPLCTCS